MTRKMKIITIAATAVVLAGTAAGVALSTDSQTKPNPAACKTAMGAQFVNMMADLNDLERTKPKACDGLSDQQMEKLAGQVLAGD